MLEATEQERQDIADYMAREAAGEPVTLLQKVYSELLHSIRHDIWDVHTASGRWWVITSPTNLYSQEQFPDMDLALTFHVGLCMRVPKQRRESSFESLDVEPLTECWRLLSQAQEALEQAAEAEDFQAIGMRCREALLAFVQSAEVVVEQTESEQSPKRGDFRAWSALIAAAVVRGSSHKDRRSLLRSTAESAWKYVNWLTHARNATSSDAEAAISSTDLVLSLFTSAWIRHVRGIPNRCPNCRSHKLSPERGLRTDQPGNVYERPVCTVCGWTGEPVLLVSRPPSTENQTPPEGECVISTVPLTGSDPPKPSHEKG